MLLLDIYKTPPKCYAVNQNSHPLHIHLCRASSLNANIFSAVVVYTVHHPDQNTIAHNPAVVEVSLRCSILQLDSYSPSTAKISVELCQDHYYRGSLLGLVVAATATESDTAVLAVERFVVGTEPVGPVAEHVAVRSIGPAGRQDFEHEALPVAEHILGPRSVLLFEHHTHPATAAVDVPQSLAALHCSELLLV